MLLHNMTHDRVSLQIFPVVQSRAETPNWRSRREQKRAIQSIVFEPHACLDLSKATGLSDQELLNQQQLMTLLRTRTLRQVVDEAYVEEPLRLSKPVEDVVEESVESLLEPVVLAPLEPEPESEVDLRESDAGQFADTELVEAVVEAAEEVESESVVPAVSVVAEEVESAPAELVEAVVEVAEGESELEPVDVIPAPVLAPVVGKKAKKSKHG